MENFVIQIKYLFKKYLFRVYYVLESCHQIFVQIVGGILMLFSSNFLLFLQRNFVSS
jgi:hypothetical protein